MVSKWLMVCFLLFGLWVALTKGSDNRTNGSLIIIVGLLLFVWVLYSVIVSPY